MRLIFQAFENVILAKKLASCERRYLGYVCGLLQQIKLLMHYGLKSEKKCNFENQHFFSNGETPEGPVEGRNNFKISIVP